jgi:hypothetical protein
MNLISNRPSTLGFIDVNQGESYMFASLPQDLIILILKTLDFTSKGSIALLSKRSWVIMEYFGENPVLLWRTLHISTELAKTGYISTSSIQTGLNYRPEWAISMWYYIFKQPFLVNEKELGKVITHLSCKANWIDFKIRKLAQGLEFVAEKNQDGSWKVYYDWTKYNGNWLSGT